MANVAKEEAISTVKWVREEGNLLLTLLIDMGGWNYWLKTANELSDHIGLGSLSFLAVLPQEFHLRRGNPDVQVFNITFPNSRHPVTTNELRYETTII